MARWKRGESGNPAGRPVAPPPVVKPRPAATIAQQLIDSECAVLVQTAIEMAKGGDSVALKICMDRLVPPRKSQPLSFPLPVVEDDARLPEAVMKAVIKSVGSGDVTPTEAQDVVALLKTYMEAREHTQLVDEIERLRAEVDDLRSTAQSAPKPESKKTLEKDERPLAWGDL